MLNFVSQCVTSGFHCEAVENCALKVILERVVRNYHHLVRNNPEERTLSANVSEETADGHIGPPYNSANKHHR